MLIKLRNDIIIEPCTFTAVVGPVAIAIALINENDALQRFLTLFISCNFSRILSDVSRTSSNFDVRRPFTAHQMQTVLQEVSHSVVFIEHDPTLYDGALEMIPIIGGYMRDVSRETTVIFYSPKMDRSFSALTQKAHRLIYFTTGEEERYPLRMQGSNKQYEQRVQRTLDSWNSGKPATCLSDSLAKGY